MIPMYVQKMQEHLDRGERNARATLAKEPDRPSTKRILANILKTSRRVEEALVLLESVGAVYTSDANYWSELGFCYLLLGRYDEGYSAISRAMNLEPSRCKGRDGLDNRFFCNLCERLQRLAASAPEGQSIQLDKDELWEEYWQEISRPWRETWGE